MTITNHVLTGAVIAVAIKNPYAAVVLAYASHFLLDSIPHFGTPGISTMDVFQRNKKRSFQLTIGLSTLLTVFLIPLIVNFTDSSVSTWRLAVCMLAAILPDVVWVYRFVREIFTHTEKPRGPISEFHVRIQNDSLLLGAATESIWFVAMLALILVFSR